MTAKIKQLAHNLLSRVSLLIWMLFTVAATIMGPFNTSAVLGLGQRGIYWGVMVALALSVSAVVAELVALVVPDRRRWAFDILRIIGMVLVFSPMVLLWTNFMLGDVAEYSPDLGMIALFVALVGTVTRVMRRILRDEQATFLHEEQGALALPGDAEDVPGAGADLASPENADQPRLMRRLPDGVTGPVLRLSAKDHFVEVVLPDETHSLRMRFADAIDEMDGVEGYCAHRSHWVARDTIDAVERDGARIYLRLVNRDVIPVSRTYKPRLEEAGIL
jgi:hypothetical protein